MDAPAVDWSQCEGDRTHTSLVVRSDTDVVARVDHAFTNWGEGSHLYSSSGGELNESSLLVLVRQTWTSAESRNMTPIRIPQKIGGMKSG